MSAIPTDLVDLEPAAAQAEVKRLMETAIFKELVAYKEIAERHIDEAEAELAALKGRRCDGCHHWQPRTHIIGTFDCDIEACGERWLDRFQSFSGSEWTERQP